MAIQSVVSVRMSRHGVLNRRGFLRSVGVGAGGLAVASWLDVVSSRADELRKQQMSCILLWMGGGPSQFETFDPKPESANGGETNAIATSVSGVRIAEHWPQTARVMDDIAIIRSMTNKEGNHQRASYQWHTGYLPSGSVKHPNFGSSVCSEISDIHFDLPHFVCIQGAGGPGGMGATPGSGFLGVEYDPFFVLDPNRPPNNTTLSPGVTDKRYTRRLGLAKKLEQDFAKSGGEVAVQDHQVLYDKAAKMVLSPNIKAFDLSHEPDSLREQYGKSAFGQGCLLARRLVETGVTFVEVRSNGWDTHQQNFTRVPALAKQVDPAFATLLADLKQRGLLDRTLVVWMGEFGRTPRINGNGGRDHWPRSFNAALAGAGIKGGQVIGSTNGDGTEVKDQPVGVTDLLSSFCHALRIDPRKENMSPLGRPLKIVDGGTALPQLFS